MIAPTRIRIRNIRSIRDGEITIPETGITALHGPVGSGKSTFLSAMVWALYGEVPGGLKQADMRRTGADGEPCEAEVEFRFNGQTYTAVRGLRQRGARGETREVAYARWWAVGAAGPGQDERQISPSKLTQKITELSGLSGRAYCGAFFIAQGQLTDLAEGTPAQVQQLFEEQTGLGALTKTVERRSAEARQAEEQAAAMPGSREETDAARQALDAAQQDAAQAHDEHEQAADLAQQATERLRTADQTAEALQQRHRSAEQARIDHARAEERVRHWQKRVGTLTAHIADAGTVPEAPETLAQHLDALRGATRAAEQALGQAAVAERHATEADAQARQIQTEADALADPELERRISAAKQQQNEYEQQRGALKGEYTRLSRALEALTASETACCPTCVQPLRDVHGLITDLHQQRERCITDGKNAKAKAEAAAQHHEKLLSRQQQLAQVTARLEAVRAQAATVRQQAETARQAVDQALDAMAAQLPDTTSPVDREHLLDHGRAAIDQLGEDLTQARNVYGLRSQLADAEAELAAARTDLVGRAAGATDVSDTELTEAAAALAAARAGHATALTAASEANTRFQVAAERARVLARAHEEAEARMHAKADRLHDAHILHTAVDLLAAYRRALLAEYTAAVSQAATDVLTQITDRHVRFEIDDTFVPRVYTTEGTMRPTRVLSGGEKATAALAFRLGITEQITGGSTLGMIIADEITAAHDADTRRAVLTCLSELGWPALVVSHGEEITETAQRVIRLHQADEATGTVVAA
ncbi:SMC family ATPase [Streptomyces abikoensis]|uniref:SMC family ATPase n=1 Tax=Streptomyces abikoensis TaxID=97398 RepID=UPI003404C5A6